MDQLDLILSRFEQISSIPRGTKHEAEIRGWLINWAIGHGLEHKSDTVGNLVIYVPASAGYDEKQIIILQGHLDMVWQKTAASDHDFTRDPIRLIREGDWLKAGGTTLGADNGIAIALMLALVEDEHVLHPALELLFTVEEELGVVGADHLDPGLISGKSLVNLDSEEEGVFTVGCAGGGSVYIHLPVEWEPASANDEFFHLHAGGLHGGHSGEDINRQRANANKLLARTLDDLQREIPIRLVSFKGGTARNAIPRDADAMIACPAKLSGICREKTASFENLLRAEYAVTEDGLALNFEQINGTERVMRTPDTQKAIQLLMSLPHGVAEMSAEVQGFVETSNNIGIVDTLDDGLHITSNHRSSVTSRLEDISRRVESIARLAGANTERTKIFPPWKPDMDSALLKRSIQVYEGCFGQKPRVELSHGGLECGIISDRCGGLDTLSLGPTIENPHSPDEKLYVPSLPKTWKFLSELLGSC